MWIFLSGSSGTCAILIESDEAFFDSASDEVPLEIREELRRSFFYLNLNGRQSLLLFKDVYCDYVLVAKNVYNLLKRLHPVRFHLAVSRRFDGYQELPEIMEQLEQQMEEKFYHPDIHVYTSEEDEEKIPEKRSRIPGLWKNTQKIFPERM